MGSKAQRLYQFEFYSLCIIAISIPLFEASKHLFCLIYLFLFTYRSLRYRETFAPSPLGKYILLFIAGSIIASIGASLNGYEAKKLHDIIRYSLIGWLIIHTPLSQKQLYTLCIILITSTLAASIEGCYLLKQGSEIFFELKSVGHINHSAIYILLTIGISIPLLVHLPKVKWMWLLVILANILGIFFLLKTNSRATAIGLTVILIGFIASTFFINKKIFYSAIGIIILSTPILISNPPKIVDKFIYQHNTYSEKMSPRERIWNTAFHAWKKEPIFGVGFGNYSAITLKKMQEWYKNSDIDAADTKYFLYYPHAHNRFFNTLAEGGIIGLASLLILLGGAYYLLIKSFKSIRQNPEHLFYWLIGVNTLTTICVVGLFNTTLHHEHGLLSMILLGLCFNYLYSHIPLKRETA